MSKQNIQISNLKPGVRYTYRTQKYPGLNLEGTFDKVENKYGFNEYFFSNVQIHVYSDDYSDNKEVFEMGSESYPRVIYYPYDIHLYNSNKLPGDLNRMINTYGGKSRKNRKSKRRNRKSKKNRKSNRRNKKFKKI